MTVEMEVVGSLRVFRETDLNASRAVRMRRKRGWRLSFRSSSVAPARHTCRKIFNVYGPRGRPNDDRVVNNFGDQLLKGKPLAIFGNGTQTPSFCYIGNLVEEILRFVAAEYKGIDTAS